MFTSHHRGGSGPPLLCLHGFTDTWRTWELVLPALERVHDVLAPTLPGHAGGPPLEGDVSTDAVLDMVEATMDAAGFETAHIAGNSLGGYVALRLAARGRARSVVALAPAGGWAPGDLARREVNEQFTRWQALAKASAPHAHQILATPAGRARVAYYVACHTEHIPAELLAHQMLGWASCPAAAAMLANEAREPWALDAERIACPVRIVWGTGDRILHWPSAAARYRHEWLPHADWVELDGVGHSPQLDVPLETAQLILGWTATPRSARSR